ncbi:helix-turn-helix domain-containing protein [Streptococcus salivarius]
MDFSEFLKNYRVEKNLSKKEVAAILDISPMYYGRFEKGDLLPTKWNINRFSENLDIPVEELTKFMKKPEE